MGWVVWREKENVPEEMIFWVDYLGGNEPDLSINFSRPGAQILLQYYNFLHLGKSGYRRVQKASIDNARYMADELAKMPCFDVYTAAEHMPLITWKMKDGYTDKWDVYDLSDKLRARGWQIPAYPLTANATNVHVLRVVFRNGVSRDMCDLMLSDIERAVDEYDKLVVPLPRDVRTTTTFDHT